ncbi:prepilin-type N-terminal cleavage/methylation domain-containing protein [bacterium]|nr:prepilin-type N-terminal cleavage/methylation domain-containing protein [bacterium]
MRKSGFTLAEFIISITVMLIVMAAVFPVMFNKVKAGEKPVRFDGEKVCSCQNNSNCSEFELDEKGRHEFVTVQLIGGGGGGGTAAGGTAVGGSAGEVKIINYPFLKGTFKVVLGNGGAVNDNGGTTALYRKTTVNGAEAWELLASARGGISNKELAEKSINTSLGEDTPSKFGCGKGGNGGAAGAMGEVVISW